MRVFLSRVKKEFIEDINLIITLNSVIYARLLLPGAQSLFWALRLRPPPFFLRWHSTPSITFFPSVHRGVQCFEAPGVSRKTEVEALRTSDESLWKCHVSVFGSFNCFCAGVVLISVRERWTVAGWHMPVGMPHSNVHGNVVAKASSVVAFVCHGSHFVDVGVPDICRRKS